MNNNAKISLKHASLGYKKSSETIAILQNLNLDFHSGDFIGIVGLNGIGKSTFLKSICGLLPVLKGEVFIDGESILNSALTDLAKKISIVLTEKIGGFNLTAHDVVAAGQMPYTDSFHRLRQNNIDIISKAIEACGIKDHQWKPVNELSDGLFQKTIIAKALAQQTPIMLLDEPSAFLDYASKHELFILLKKLTEEENKCVLVSSHDLDLIIKYCNKLLIFSEDSVELIPVSEVSANKSFRRIGGGYL
ncbi:ABC transporter ATP-binding protein [Aurantibacillus circumpalustris]|uniref:ABC transporter ATP-binding protein n=1 Tax=Aurantibacillus circumpalustris TaxID=3036359 RepID=UPI00295A9CD4|nr:ABC transporter ATP-binding protein [Aurantibacillus circumpalustris]